MIFLPKNASKARLREAENARRNRAEVKRAINLGQVTRRDLMKWGLITAGGLFLAKNGFSPFAKSAFAAVPTGTPPSPVFPGFVPFTQLLPRLNLMTPIPLEPVILGGGKKKGKPAPRGEIALQPKAGLTGRAGELAAQWGAPATRRANTTPITHTVNLATGPATGPVGPTEGRAPGEFFAHQRWNELINNTPFGPVGYLGTLGQIKAGQSFFEMVNSVTTPSAQFPQEPNAVWPFGEGRFVRGVLPPPIVQARYGEPVLFRNFCNLPFPIEENGGFGRNEPSIHNHNAHNGAESDGANNSFIFPGEYYDLLWSTILARSDEGLVDSLGRDLDTLLGIRRGDPRASTPTNDGGIELIPGDFRQIQNTLWFHDHRFFFTAENVYKGFASLLEYFSGLDRGNERINDGVNLRLPSGWLDKKTWGNRDFDVYLLVQDIALDPNGQLFFDIFDTDGFLGDVMHVNYQVAPVFEVLPRKYRFRILSAGMSRWIQLAIADGNKPGANAVPVRVIANDGNLFPQPITLQQLSIQGTAERLDIVIDFSQGLNPSSQIGKEYFLVNLLEFSNGRGPDQTLSLGQALSGMSADPAVGAIMKFKVVGSVPSIDDPTVTLTIDNACGANDQSQVPATLTEQIPIVDPVRERVIEFVRNGDAATEGGLPFDHPADPDPWAIVVNGVAANKLDDRRVSNLIPRPGDIENWTIRSGKGWGHPVHLHFEEGVTMNRNGDPIPPTELLKRKDVWRVGRLSGDVQFQVTFGEFGGAYVNHCHNTVHEDNAMLLRYDNNNSNFRKTGDKVHDAGIVILPTPDPRPEGVTYVESCVLPEGNMTNIATGVDDCVSGESVGPAVTNPIQDLP